jgi:hypothetical protein
MLQGGDIKSGTTVSPASGDRCPHGYALDAYGGKYALHICVKAEGANILIQGCIRTRKQTHALTREAHDTPATDSRLQESTPWLRPANRANHGWILLEGSVVTPGVPPARAHVHARALARDTLVYAYVHDCEQACRCAHFIIMIPNTRALIRDLCASTDQSHRLQIGIGSCGLPLTMVANMVTRSLVHSLLEVPTTCATSITHLIKMLP